MWTFLDKTYKLINVLNTNTHPRCCSHLAIATDWMNHKIYYITNYGQEKWKRDRDRDRDMFFLHVYVMSEYKQKNWNSTNKKAVNRVLFGASQ